MPLPEPKPLDAADRCDRCSARALVVVALGSSTLMFCGHDFNANDNEQKLALAGAKILVDERGHRGPPLLERAQVPAAPAPGPVPVTSVPEPAGTPGPEVEPTLPQTVPASDLHAHPGTHVLRETMSNGNVRTTRTNGRGRLSDGPMGEPAVETVHHATGRPVAIEHYDDGAKQDSVSGQPGETWYFPDGTPHCRRYHHRGRLNDTSTGIPAVVYLNQSGAVVRAMRYVDGQIQAVRKD